MKRQRFGVALYHYLAFFLLMAFLITCCMVLFLNTLSRSMDIEFTTGNLRMAAVVTFGNVVFLALVCTVVDALRRKVTVERPVRRIVEAAERITKGDYTVRIPRLKASILADGLDEIAECFNIMTQELSSTETLQTDFITNVSHEIKTPLAVMRNYGTLLQQTELPEEKRIEYAQGITDATRRLSSLITNILKLNKLENQQIFPVVSRFDLGEQLCECLLSFESLWERKAIEIDTEIEDNVCVETDPELLSLVWNNLFSNAFKFTEAGDSVRLELKTDDLYAIVQVTDTGCGISPEIGAHIFEKFYQGDPSHATQGNGLGLALVRRVIDIVGGDISVQSQVGHGSTFTVKLRRCGNGTV